MQTKSAIKPNSIYRVKVWPAALRLAHWLMAGGFVVLMATGWLIASGRYLGEAPVDFHYLAAYLVLAGLGIRLWLLFSHPALGNWRALWPSREQWRAVPAMVKFYLSFGRLDLPRWFAHNPLWAPIYLLWIALLVGQAGLGVALIQDWGPDVAIRSWHAGVAQLLIALFGFHLVAVVLHELRGRRCDTSAMIHGYRVFDLAPLDPAQLPDSGGQVVRFEPRPRVSKDV